MKGFPESVATNVSFDISHAMRHVHDAIIRKTSPKYFQPNFTSTLSLDIGLNKNKPMNITRNAIHRKPAISSHGI